MVSTSKLSIHFSLLAILLATFTTAASAAVLTVDISPTSGNYNSIQAAIDVAVSGTDSVEVLPGTYNENINFNGKNIHVYSRDGSATTIIDGGGTDAVVIFENGETTAAILEGFNIRNGNATSAGATPFGSGGGISISSSSPTILNNIIQNNKSTSPGFGLDVNFGSPIIQGNTIQNNDSNGDASGGGGGGGIALGGAGSAQVIDNSIINNSTTGFSSGGGIYMNAAGTPVIRNNWISGNSANSGAGIAMVNTSDADIIQNAIMGNIGSSGSGGGIHWIIPNGNRGPYLVSNTISGNTAATGAAIYSTGDATSVILNNNILSGGTHCESATVPTFNNNMVYLVSGNCSTASIGASNVLSAPTYKDAINKDYSLASGSPGIDAGDNAAAQLQATDYAGKSRILDGTVDIGAF